MSSARICSQLEKVGFTVQTSRRLPETASSPELVIIDIGSRSLPGIELIKSSLEQFPVARVIAFCGHAEVEIRRAAKQAGLSRILTNDEALTNLVNALKLSACDGSADEKNKS